MLITDNQLEELILKNKLIDEKGIADILEYAKNNNVDLKEALIEKNIIGENELGLLMSDFLKIPFISLTKIAIPQEILHIVPERMARKFKVIAYERDNNGIKIATTDPTNKELIQMLAKKTNSPIITYLASERDINNAIQIYRKDLQKSIDALINASNKEIEVTADVPVAKIVDILITYAFQDKASDIHIEPEEKNSLIRFRIDGILHDVLILPKNLHDQIITRIKVESRLRTDKHLSAQDGKMRLKIDGENLDIRVSIIPITEGEKVVLRLLSTHSRQFSLTDLGMNDHDLAIVTRAFKKSFGMVLSTGPTGSGKSTSIYAILKILNTREKNITTIEDPVEYRIKGVNQIHVNVKTNLTFAQGLRSILRQDPNVIFVGEIRDTETAGIAVNAALTGHLVLSTLHTNDAATTLPRLTDMGIEPFLVASTVNVIVAQRLLRKICESCKTSYTVTQQEFLKNIPQTIFLKHFDNKTEIRVYKGAGCKICHNTGFSGRIGIFEVLEITKTIKKLITEKVDSDVIAKQAVDEGMTTMLDDGLDKVIKGITTIEEVLRVTKIEAR